MADNSEQQGTLERFKRYYTLLNAPLRYTVIIALPIVTAILFIATGIGVVPDKGWGQAVGFGGALFLLGVIVEHITNVVNQIDHRTVEVFAEEAEASNKQHKLIEQEKPKNVKLCEYSSYEAVPYLRKLSSLGDAHSVKLLICDPCDVSKDQRGRIMSALNSLQIAISTEKAQRMGFRIKCYSPQRASLRGRNYDGKFVILGWYTVHQKPGSSEPLLFGAHNAVLMAMCKHPHGEQLRVFFDEVFGSLWQEAVPLQEALSAIGETDYQLSPEWLTEVSQDQDNEGRL